MTRPDPIPFDDQDPFADSFASFDEDAADEGVDESAVASEPAHALAGEASKPVGDVPLDDGVEATSPNELAPAALAEAELAPPPEKEALERSGEEPAVATPTSRETAFDWFADFPSAGPAPHAPAAPSEGGNASGLKKPFGWFSAFAKTERKPEPEAAADMAAAIAPRSDDTPLDIGTSHPELADTTPEPEALASAPSVPAAFDDALTQPEPFALADNTFEDEHPAFSPADPAPAAATSPVAEMIASAEAALGEAVVPRIAIHVFAQRAETAAVAQTAAADRRLQRASTAIRPGGLPEALALYASSPTPALVIVENTAPAMQLLADLDRLAEVCDPGTKVVVIGEANDIGLYRELIRRGVSEYLVPPLNPLQLIRTIGGLYADPATPFVGRTLAFVGAKGGVGSSTLAHNVAWCLAERIEAQACVVDYDLAFGTAGLDFNQDPVQGLHDALAKPDRLDATLIDRMLARCTERLSLFAAPATLDDDYDISSDVYEEVAGKIRSTAPFMVLDLPHVWSGWMRKTLLAADEVVLVAQPDLASLRNAKNLIELITKARPNDMPPRLVLNQVGLPGRPEIPLKDFSKALGVEPTMVVPFDAKLFGQAANNGQMIAEVNPKAKAADAILQFAQAITRREAAAPKPKSLVERLLKGG